MDLGTAMERAMVLEWSLQEQLRPYMSCMKPRPSIYNLDFIAANQESRADNVLTGTMAEQVCKALEWDIFIYVLLYSYCHTDLNFQQNAFWAGEADQS